MLQAQPYNRSVRPRSIVMLSIAAAIAVFLVVQDRATAAGAREYIERQRAAAAGRIPGPTIEEVMRPAVRLSVRLGLLAGGVVLMAGLGTAAAATRRKRWRQE